MLLSGAVAFGPMNITSIHGDYTVSVMVQRDYHVKVMEVVEGDIVSFCLVDLFSTHKDIVGVLSCADVSTVF